MGRQAGGPARGADLARRRGVGGGAGSRAAHPLGLSGRGSAATDPRSGPLAELRARTGLEIASTLDRGAGWKLSPSPSALRGEIRADRLCGKAVGGGRRVFRGRQDEPDPDRAETGCPKRCAPWGAIARSRSWTRWRVPSLANRFGERDQRFLHESSFGKTLYAWRVQMLPKNVEELQAQAETERLLGVLLIPVSTLIIAVGLAVVWLTVIAERRTSRMKSDFIANVSHELKTPLSLIRMFGELLATGKHKGESTSREYAEIITREAERLSHLIDNVLDFARIERGKASYDFAEGRLDEVVERALDVCRYRVEKEKMRLRTTMEAGLPPVRMDENAMTLVLLNLIDNAVKYAAEGKDVDVTLGRTPGGVRAVRARPRSGHPRGRTAADFRALLSRAAPRATATCAAAASGWPW